MIKVQTTLAVIVASVPVGFVVYQMYYAAYGPLAPLGRLLSPWRLSPYVTRDRGADIFGPLPPKRLAQLRYEFGARLDVRTWYLDRSQSWTARRLNLPQLDETALRAAYPPDAETTTAVAEDAMRGAPSVAFPHVEIDPRSATRIYADNWRENWTVFRSLLDLAAVHADAKELKTEFTTLSDIYHALGASRIAVLLGGGLAAGYTTMLYSYRFVDHPLRAGGGAIIVVLAVLYIARMFHRARAATWRSAVACAHYGLRWCFKTHPEFMQLRSDPYPFEPRTASRQRGQDQDG